MNSQVFSHIGFNPSSANSCYKIWNEISKNPVATGLSALNLRLSNGGGGGCYTCGGTGSNNTTDMDTRLDSNPIVIVVV